MAQSVLMTKAYHELLKSMKTEKHYTSRATSGELRRNKTLTSTAAYHNTSARK